MHPVQLPSQVVQPVQPVHPVQLLHPIQLVQLAHPVQLSQLVQPWHLSLQPTVLTQPSVVSPPENGRSFYFIFLKNSRKLDFCVNIVVDEIGGKNG